MSDARPTRERIVALADRLFYEHGYEHTSFADIAADVGISRGNFYHHFRSKDEILDAVIGVRLDDTRRLLERWEAQADGPAGRILCFVRIVVANQGDIFLHGCPVGTLCTELRKLGHPAHEEARALFTLFRDWLRHQFELLGHGRDADALAMHVLAFSQGVAVLAHAFNDPEFVGREVARMQEWLHALPAPAALSASRARTKGAGR